MNSLTLREKSMLGIVLYLSLIIAVYWFRYLPARLEAEGLNLEMENLQREYLALENNHLNSRYDQLEREELEAELENTHNILPEDPALISLVDFIAHAAVENQVM